MKDVSEQAKNKAVIAAGLAAIIFSGVFIGYIGKLNKFYEMTFISNTFAACVTLAGAIKLIITGKDLPHFLYLDATALLLVVVGICVSFAPAATLLSPSVVLHLVNPVLMLCFYLNFCDARGVKNTTVLTALVVPGLYYIFMIVFGRVTGGYIYPYFDPNKFGAGLLVLFGAIAIVLIVAVGLLIMRLNRHIRHKRENAENQRREERVTKP